MKLLLSCLLLFLLSSAIFGKAIRNTSYVSSAGEKVLRLEFELPIDKREAWRLFTTPEGWKTWATPVVSIDFRIGGQIMSHYDKTKSPGDPGTIRLPILNYLEGEMLTLKVILNDNFPEKLRHEDQNLQEVTQFFDLGNGKTKIVSSMIGWGKGDDWDHAYEFFAKGNEWIYENLIKSVYQKSKATSGQSGSDVFANRIRVPHPALS